MTNILEESQQETREERFSGGTTMSQDSRGRSVTVEKARDILGDVSDKFSDERLQGVLDVFYGISLGAYEDFINSTE